MNKKAPVKIKRKQVKKKKSAVKTKRKPVKNKKIATKKRKTIKKKPVVAKTYKREKSLLKAVESAIKHTIFN